MNDNTTISPDPAALADPRPAYGTSLDIALTVLDQVTDESAGRPTPCTEFDVGFVARHLIAGIHRTEAAARGIDMLSVKTELEPIEPAHYRAAFDQARADQEAAWADDAVLSRNLTLPFAVLPGAAALAVFVGEVTIHTWDLATALGVNVDWDEPTVDVGLAGWTAGLPAEPRGADIGVPFDPVVPTAADAPAIERLVAWTGRTPPAIRS